MIAPKSFEQGYDYTEFDGMPLEWWQGYQCRHKTIRPDIGGADKKMLAALIPDTGLHQHVARIGRSREEGHTTLLTTSGHVIQFIPDEKATAGNEAKRGAVYASTNVDAKGIALVMSHYGRDGFKFTPDQIPFTKTASAEFKDHVRTLWAEAQKQQKPQAETSRPKPTAGVPAYA